MKNVLIVNLTRMGDIVQSGALALEIKRAYPHCFVTMLINSQFSGTCSLVSGVDDFKMLEFGRLRDFLSGRPAHIAGAYGYLKSFFDSLTDVEYDRIINITPHDIGVLSTFAAAGGFGKLMHHQRLAWAMYYLCITRNWESLPFHIVDIYKEMAGLEPAGITPGLALGEKESIFAHNFLKEHGVEDRDLLIGLNPGASDTTRCWPAEYFCELGSKILHETPAKIIIYGSASEVRLAEQIKHQVGGNIINASGRTDIAGLAALLNKTDVLITNDTGPMHLAAAVGTQTIGIYMGKAFCATTGAYAPGHIAVQPKIECYPCARPRDCRSIKCREYISPGAVYRALELILKGGSEPDGDDPPSVEAPFCSLLVSAFDESNFMTYRPLKRSLIDYAVFCRILARYVLRRVLNEDIMSAVTNSDVHQAADRAFQYIRRYYNFRCSKYIEESWQADQKTLRHLSRLSSEGLSLTNKIEDDYSADPGRLKHLKKLTDKIEETDRIIISCGKTLQAQAQSILLFCFEKEQMRDGDLKSLTAQTARIYRRLAAGCELMEKAGQNVLKRLIEDNLLKAAS